MQIPSHRCYVTVVAAAYGLIFEDVNICMHACRDQDARDIFSVNAISFHPRNTFCSAGSDGVLTIWDKEAR